MRKKWMEKDKISTRYLPWQSTCSSRGVKWQAEKKKRSGLMKAATPMAHSKIHTWKGTSWHTMHMKSSDMKLEIKSQLFCAQSKPRRGALIFRHLTIDWPSVMPLCGHKRKTPSHEYLTSTSPVCLLLQETTDDRERRSDSSDVTGFELLWTLGSARGCTVVQKRVKRHQVVPGPR